MKRTLIAGFGNVLRGDDGFGVEVLRRLADRNVASASVELLDVGTGGIRLAQALLTPFDRLIILDAATRGGAPGSVYTLRVDDVRPTREIDMHTAVPSRALEVARAFGRLPGEIYLVGCEPASVDELSMELSPRIAAALDVAVRAVENLLRDNETRGNGGAGNAIAREDELLELLYWFEGEGFRGAADMANIVRFTATSESEAGQALERLIARGDVALRPGDGGAGQYVLTETGRREAARRFAAEFAPLLSQGHGECSDPDCDCHTSDGGAADCRAHTRDHAH